MKLTVVELFAGVGGFRVGLNHVNVILLDLVWEIIVIKILIQ